ncbi:mRNA-binding protein RRP12 KNAG_0D02550 [Huiozyma naganishii CBS 8797]|uniref:Uncharacterized protein n=1 Tax=Huiozyma naganishii (strain ATCC MYA-139 / BCRC 22969 / CBS 8797 / KCTC 17520 / NBRC 10181 / NCYC 3082 / Yp74L-3) TaxID=1071383 RepID=J7S5U1_HUIN7|nr:hypothetical protein KNAG_0D02550 [Kazachstania naganishii CBS 8797]CCK70004.1 hypothetical protein KNAG_0D02550 [Kazachstania naganishii CBS 8797]
MDADQVAKFLELDEKLSKVRSQATSKLLNQKTIAITLVAVEENISNFDTNEPGKNLINYLIAFLSLLDTATDAEGNIQNYEVATSAVYLLDILLHYTPNQLLRSKFIDILTKVAPYVVIDTEEHSMLIRSAIGCLEALLVAQDAQAWNNTHNLAITPRRALQGLLELSLDHRPKIRKRALESISVILSSPPAAPTSEHVASLGIADFVMASWQTAINELSQMGKKKKKNQQQDEDALSNDVIKLNKLINTVVSTGQWPSKYMEPLCDYLLEIIKSSNQYLVASTFQCFENLFQSIADFSTKASEAKYLLILDTIFSMKPANSDTHLASAWMAVIVKAMSTYASIQPLNCFERLPKVFEVFAAYLQSDSKEIAYSASQSLIGILTESVKDELLLRKYERVQKVDKIVGQLSKRFVDFLSVRYANSANEVLQVIAVAYQKFGYKSAKSIVDPLVIVDKWRNNEKHAHYMELQGGIELVVGSAITAMGPDVVLRILPLNLTNNQQPGRAWLLPLLRDYTKHAKLSTFVTELTPVIKSFTEKIAPIADTESIQLKIFQTILDQLWSTLPHFTELPSDLRTAFTDEFAQELCSLMYSNVELRTTICHSLKVLVESNLAYTQNSLEAPLLLQEVFPVEETVKNLEYLTSKAVNLLAVLFNVYTQTAPNTRGYILETIESLLKITTPVDLEKTFNNVCTLLKDAMEKEAKLSGSNRSGTQLTSTLLDIIITMVKYLPETSYAALFSIFDITIKSTNTLVQKRAYRIINKLSELDPGSTSILEHIRSIKDTMVSNAETVQTASRSARLTAIKTLIKLLPLDQLDFIVKIVAEVILSTKDVNEKTREAAFDILLLMGHKMQEQGGVIRMVNENGLEDMQPSSVGEFFKIISVGLIGESQHMVSSTITAFACLLFEFKESLPGDIILEVYDTIELYLTSNSREIVKSAIGFTKVCVLGLPVEMMRSKIPGLLVNLLRWSNEHTGHFKQRVKHIIERLIRRFGYDFIAEHFPESDMKLLANIRKIRNRSKRETGADSEILLPDVAKGPKFMSAFDEAIYDSASDTEDRGDAEQETAGKGKRQASQKYIVEKSGDNPLDLLDSETLAHISTTRPKKFQKGKKGTISDDMFNFDAEGKLVMKGAPAAGARGQSQNRDDGEEDPLKSVTNGINAYLEAVKQGPVRGQKNKLKFKNRAGQDAESQGFSDDEDNRKTLGAKPQGNRVGKKQGGRQGGKQGGKFKSRRKL